MYLYRLSQSVARGYDTYDSCVVAAESEDDARLIHPSCYIDLGDLDSDCFPRYCDTWANRPSDVTVKLIGTAIDGTEPNSVICASFNAG